MTLDTTAAHQAVDALQTQHADAMNAQAQSYAEMLATRDAQLAKAQTRPAVDKTSNEAPTMYSLANKHGLTSPQVVGWNADLDPNSLPSGTLVWLIDRATVPASGEPQPPPEPTPTPTPTSPVDFSEHVGFGNPRLTNPISRLVDSDADSGPGSLRGAVAGDVHKIVMFADDMDVTARSVLNPGPNTAISGRGRNVTVHGTLTSGAFDISQVYNVTLADFSITDCGNLALTGADDPHDGIIITGSDVVWLHHLDISRCSDKGTGMRQGAKNVTASWCHYHDQVQTFQSGNDFDGEVQGSLARLTIHHTWWDHTGYRHPVMSYGLAHIYNNLYDDFELYGARSQRIAKMYFENNPLNLVRNNRVTLISGTGGTQKDTRPGYLVPVGNVALPGSLAPSFQTAAHDFRPSDYYAYTAEPAGQALADRIKAGAGPR